jgi:cyclophilin family peptidyl-prolyl cis-trans isomerase
MTILFDSHRFLQMQQADDTKMIRFLIVLLFITFTNAFGWTAPTQASTKSVTTLEMIRRRDVLEGTFLAPVVAAATALLNYPGQSLASYIDPSTDPPAITKRVFLDVSFGDDKNNEQGGRLVIGLYGDSLPKTVENFVTLCASNAYAGTTFYRVISDVTIQGGAIGDPTGKTGKSSLEGGQSFEPDNFNIKHSKAGIVSMVKGPNGVDSRFFINCSDNGGWADDRYAAFGIVEEGMELIKKIEKVPVSPPKNSPKTDVKILASGVL